MVVFGGTGFIGSSLCLLFSKQGYNVVCLGRTNPFTGSDKIKFHSIDFHNTTTWEKLIEEGDYVCNLIALHISKDVKGISDEIHLSAIEKLIEQCLTKKVKNLLYLSSGGSIYGRGNMAFSEIDVPAPVSPYGFLKLKSEKLLITSQERFGLPLSIARPSNIYGESQSAIGSVGVITNFYHRIARHIPLDIYGDLEIRKDYLHVEDLVKGLSSICIGHKTGIYNLGFGQTHTLGEIIYKIELLLQKKASLNFHPLKDSDIHSYALNCNKARIELGFNPSINLDAGINRYYQKGLK